MRIRHFEGEKKPNKPKHVFSVVFQPNFTPKQDLEKVYFRSQILECPSIGEYWNIFGIPVLPENVI